MPCCVARGILPSGACAAAGAAAGADRRPEIRFGEDSVFGCTLELTRQDSRRADGIRRHPTASDGVRRAMKGARVRPGSRLRALLGTVLFVSGCSQCVFVVS